MKLENNQSYGVNAQFSGGRPIGQSSNGAINLTFANRSFDFSSVANYTGSFTITDAYGQTNQYYLTGSNQSAVINGSSFIPVSSSIANTLVSIKNFLNASASAVVTTNSTATALQATSSLNGTAGNTVVFTWNQYSGSVVTGSLSQNLLDGQGPTDYPYEIPFVAAGLYVGIAGTLNATTIDGSPLIFVSASGFIPGLFKSVSSASTVGSVIALK